MNFVLLLSATINPVFLTKGRIDPDARENDYFLAVKFYLEKGYKVVFCENSNTSSEKILSLQTSDQRLEYLTYSSEWSSRGKAWGEIEIINLALKESNFLKQVDYIVKITGRYIITNIDEFLQGTNQVEKEVYMNPTRNLKWADTRVIIMKKSFYYNYFIPTADATIDGKNDYMEHILVRSVLFYIYKGGQLVLWPTYPFYEAIDGTYNDKVTFGFFKKLKYRIYYKFKIYVFKHQA